MKKRFLSVFIILLCALFCCNCIYAAEYTYKCKSAKRSDTFTVYEDGKYYTSIEIVDFDLKDINIETEGTLNERVIDELKSEIIDLYIAELNEILSTKAKAYKRGLIKKEYALRDYLHENDRVPTGYDSGKESYKYIREEYLAYNCNLLIRVLTRSKYEFTTPKFEELSMDFLDQEGSYYIRYESDFGDDLYYELKTKYKNIKKEWEESVKTGVLFKCRELYTIFNKQDVNDRDEPINRDPGATGTGNWWTDAQNFFNTAKDSGGETGSAGRLVGELSDLIFEIGNMIFIIVTSVLGVKYIFASAEGKANIKDSLITLIVAALFFYGWTAIRDLLNIEDLLSTGTLETTAGKIYNTVLFIVNLVAIAGVIWIGVKYMLSSAEGKAQIKTNWGPLILGIIMVYATIRFLTLIIEVVLK